MEPDRETSNPEPLCLHWRVCGQRPVQVLDRPHSLSMFSFPQGSAMSRQFLSRRSRHSDHVMDACRVTFHPAAGTGEKEVAKVSTSPSQRKSVLTVHWKD